MIRGCLFGLSLSVVVVTIAGFLNATQQAREVRGLQRTVYALRQFTATEFAETRQAAISAGREFNKKVGTQSDQLADSQRQIESSQKMLASVQQKLRSLQNDCRVEIDECQQGLASVAGKLDAHSREMASASEALTSRVAGIESHVNPLRQEVSMLATNLSARIDRERTARERLADQCRAALAAEGNMLDSYAYALQALAESRKVRAAVEQELAAEAELEASLLSQLAEDAHDELARLAARLSAGGSNKAPRVAQVPSSAAPRAVGADPVLPVLIDPNSGKVRGDSVAE